VAHDEHEFYTPALKPFIFLKITRGREENKFKNTDIFRQWNQAHACLMWQRTKYILLYSTQCDCRTGQLKFFVF